MVKVLYPTTKEKSQSRKRYYKVVLFRDRNEHEEVYKVAYKLVHKRVDAGGVIESNEERVVQIVYDEKVLHSRVAEVHGQDIGRAQFIQFIHNFRQIIFVDQSGNRLAAIVE